MVEDKKDKEEEMEFGDVESFQNKEQQFSHQNLIMKCLNKCADNGAVEMVEGRIETKMDKNGNIMTKYITDTRRQFIESITTAKNFIKCDFDAEASKKVNDLILKVKENKKHWLDIEFNWWEELDYNLKQRLTIEGKNVIQGMHNQKLYFKDNAITEELEIWREILEELNELTKRLNFYEQDTFTA